MGLVDDRGRRALLESRAHEIMAVARFALDGDEEIARLQACACRSRRPSTSRASAPLTRA